MPYIIAAGHPPLSTALSAAVCLASCTLFGVTFRYAVRQDLENLQLKVLLGICRVSVVLLLVVLLLLLYSLLPGGCLWCLDLPLLYGLL